MHHSASMCEAEATCETKHNENATFIILHFSSLLKSVGRSEQFGSTKVDIVNCIVTIFLCIYKCANCIVHLNVLWGIGSKLVTSSSHRALLTWASYQIRKIAGYACAGNAGIVFPATNFNKNRLLATPAYITSRASRTCRDACRDR